MKGKIINFFEKSFVRNVIIIVIGTAGAQAISMILSPIITRLYGPHAFGIMGTFLSIINILIPISALTYPQAIVLPKNDQEARGIMRLSLIITSIITIITLIIIVLFKGSINYLFNLNEIINFLYLIPFVVLFTGVMQVAEQWLIRTKQFSISARVTFMQSIITNGSKVGIGFFYPVSSVLIVLTALGNGVKAVMMIFFGKGLSYNIKNEKETGQYKKNLAKKYYDFPVYRAPELFLNEISNGLPILMLTFFFGPSSAGFYTIGRNVLMLPSRLLGKSVGDVFYPRFAEASNNNENLTRLIKKATIALGGIGVIPFGLVITFGPPLFSFVFGDDWVVAGEYARYIALWSFFGLINKPSIRALPVLNAQRFHLFYTIIKLITRLTFLWIGYYIFKSDLIAVAFYSISGVFLSLGLIIFTLNLSKRKC